MLSKIIPFELKHRLLNAMTPIIFLMMIFQGIWYIMGSYAYYNHDNCLMNATGILYNNAAGGGMLLMIVIAMLTATTLYRDIDQRTAQTLYTLPLNEKKFFLGRFLAAYSINLIFGLTYMIGLALVPYFGLAPADKFGPIPWLQLLHAYLIFMVPNVFMLTSVCFFGLIRFKTMAAAYIGVFLIVFLFVTGEALSSNSTVLHILMMIDAMGFVFAKHTVQNMTIEARNYGFLPMTTMFWVNRFIWLSIALSLFAYCYRQFSFKSFIKLALGGDKKKKTVVDESSHLARQQHVDVPEVTTNYSWSSHLKRMWRLSWLEFKNLTRPVSFRIVIGILFLMFAMYMVLWNPTYYIGHQMPLTSGMAATRLHMNFMLIILFLIWSGELFFKERTVGIWQITDSVPTPSWVYLLSKFMAMTGVVFIVMMMIIICGLSVQVGSGFFQIDWMHYVDAVLGFRWGFLNDLMFISLAFFLGGLTGKRYVSMILAVGYYIFLLISVDLGIIEQVRLGFGLVPGVEDYSEMNGYGHWASSGFWYFLLWLPLTVAFVLGGIHLWNRGVYKPIIKRILPKKSELHWSAKGGVVVCLLLFVFMQVVIDKKVHATRGFLSDDQVVIEDGAYESKYKEQTYQKQPEVTHVDLNLDLYPAQHRADFKAVYRLTNNTPKPIKVIYLNLDFHSTVKKVLVNGETLKTILHDPVLGLRGYRLNQTMEPESSVIMSINAEKKYQGLTQSQARADLIDNGLLMEHPVPVVGYDSDRELLMNKERREQGLEKINSRMAPIDDLDGLTEDFFALDGKSVTGNMVVSTASDQIAFAPGELVKTWKEKNRNYFKFEVKNALPYKWHIGSARYERLRQTIDGVAVTILHDPKHTYNLKLYQKAIKDGIDYIRQKLGDYPFAQLRLAEIPYYQDGFYTYANTIAISEQEGWIGDQKADDVRSYIYYTIVRELVRQWLFTNGRLANVQGAEMLWTALPGAMALQVVEKTYGLEQIKVLADKQKREYFKGRGNEPNVEPPLIYADGIDYLEEKKGAFALYRLSSAMGHDQFNQHVKQWIDKNQDKPLVFKALYDSLKAADAVNDELATVFETVEAQESKAFKIE